MKTSSLLPSLYILLAVAGCTTHSDSLAEFRLKGVINAASAPSRPAAGITIQLLDTGMDDTRSLTRFAFFTSQVQEGTAFDLKASYGWSNEASTFLSWRDEPRPYERATLAVRIQMPGCAAQEKEYRLTDLPRDGHTLVLDLKALVVPCAAEDHS